MSTKTESISYWPNEFGEPYTFSQYDELMGIEMQIENFEAELTSIEKEIHARPAESMNQFKINRAIELHFLLKAGRKYLTDCALIVNDREEQMVEEYESQSSTWSNDNLFTRDYDGI